MTPTLSWAGKALEDVLSQVNQNNPALQAARDSLRAGYEALPKAVSRFMPTLQTFADVSQVDRHRRIGKARAVTGPTCVRFINADPTQGCEVREVVGFSTVRDDNETANARSHGANMQINLFRSGGDVYSYRAADYAIEQSIAAYRETEQTVFLEAIQTYLGVLLARETIAHHQANYNALVEQLRITRQQFNIQDKTRADLEQVSARVAVAMADVANAESNYNQSVAAYVRVVGDQPPGELELIEPAMGVDLDIESLVRNAQTTNQRIRAARAAWMSALASQKVVLSQAGPTVDFYARYNESHNELDDYRVINNDIGLRFSMPLYQGGAVSSDIRRNKMFASQRRGEMYDTMRRVREGIIATWNRYKAAEARVRALREAVRAARVALNAVRAEVEVAQRLVVDELDASRDLVNNQVALERAEHDRILESYQLGYYVGQLTANVVGVRDMMPRRPDADSLRNYMPTPLNFMKQGGVYFGDQEEQ